MNRFLSSASAGVLALVAAGCATPVPQVLKPTDVPTAFTAPIPSDAQTWPKTDWWTNFGSPEMSGLVASAQTNNLDLAAAFARVLQAQAQSGIARAALFPQLSGSFDASRQGSHERAIGTGPNGTVTSSSPFIESDSYNLGLNASYQVDLFGRNRDTYHAAEDALRSSKYAQEVVALTVESNTASGYLNVLALRERIKIARANVDAISTAYSLS